MKILLTGASGFLGKYIHSTLLLQGDVTTVSRNRAIINLDLAISIPSLPQVDLVVHCAGKAHSVPKTDAQKQEFFEVNVNGTENLLKGLAQAPSLPKSFVFISTVAVYGKEKGNDIDENSSLDTLDPYGLSKIEAERIIQEWCATNGVICGILRLPLLVGENPPGNLGAMVKGIESGFYLNVDGGLARKSMVLASEVAKIITKVAEVGGVYNLTDGHHPSFYELSHLIASQMNKKKVLNLPYWMAKSIASVGDVFDEFPLNSNKLTKITSDLTFDDSKARRYLDWNPDKVLENFSIK